MAQEGQVQSDPHQVALGAVVASVVISIDDVVLTVWKVGCEVLEGLDVLWVAQNVVGVATLEVEFVIRHLTF